MNAFPQFKNENVLQGDLNVTIETPHLKVYILRAIKIFRSSNRFCDVNFTRFFVNNISIVGYCWVQLLFCLIEETHIIFRWVRMKFYLERVMLRLDQKLSRFSEQINVCR